jgi:hypothetical protein
MAVAAPKRRTAPAPPPSRTSPPRKVDSAAPARAPQKKAAPARRPRTRPTPKGRTATAPAPARRAPARKAPARKSPARKASTARKASATRKAPARAPRRLSPTSRAAAVGGQLIPLAGRTAVAVGQLPDSGLMVRMTRGRAWIAVLGVLLVGIVTLNVITLSFAASSGKIDEQITALDQENSILRARDAQRSGIGAVRSGAAPLGLAMPSSEEIHFTDAGADDVGTAALRLAAAGP